MTSQIKKVKKPEMKKKEKANKKTKAKEKRQKKKKASKAKKERNQITGMIGWCSAETLGLDKGHFVFIRKTKNGKCDVNTLTSLETKPYKFQLGKINLVRDGLIYPIPKKDDNFKKFGGIDKRVIKNIPLDKVELQPDKHINQKHHSIIRKLMK